MAKEVSDWAKANENVQVVILTSSRTNPNAPVDVLSDYDIELHRLHLGQDDLYDRSP